MTEILVNAVNIGEAKFAKTKGYRFAGKTGTAQTTTTGTPALESWFTSFSPYNDPQIVTVVFLEKAGEGAAYAAPATREILKYYYTLGSGKQFVSNSAKQ